MRLLNTSTGRFVIVKDPREVSYAILSHVWSASGEQSYQKTLAIQAKYQDDADGDILQHYSQKVQKACELARGHGFGLLWIDSTCIDQANNTELSEAINSMYLWYKRASVCYAYLETVEGALLAKEHEKATSKFRDSRWFSRGWTLQELIAPNEVLFYGKQWQLIGTKQMLVHVISQITNIDCSVLLDEGGLMRMSIAERMSWAARRETTKDEDRAYCLMGIFDVNMTPKYGEGLEKAFVRLQKAILKRNPDQTLLAWGRCVPLAEVKVRAILPSQRNDHSLPDSDPYLFAPHPKAFGNLSRTISLSRKELAERLRKDVQTDHEYVTSAQGTRTTLPFISVPLGDSQQLQLALLSCVDENENLIALVLHPSPEELHSDAMFVGAYLPSPHASTPIRTGYNSLRGQPSSEYFRLVSLPLSNIDDWGPIQDYTVYIHDYPRGQQILPQDLDIHRMTTTIPGSPHFYAAPANWCAAVLSKGGYRLADDRAATPLPESSYAWTIAGADEIKVHFEYCKCLEGDTHGFLRVRVVQDRDHVHFPKDTSCTPELEHVRNWPYHTGSGTVSHSFKLSGKTNKHRALHVSLRLAKGLTGKGYLENSARSYIIDFQILSYAAEDAALLPEAWFLDPQSNDQGTETRQSTLQKRRQNRPGVFAKSQHTPCSHDACTHPPRFRYTHIPIS